MWKVFGFGRGVCLSNLLNIERHSCLSTKAIAAVYTQYGNPTNVLELYEKDLEKVGHRDVVVKMLASPINPADINMIQGVYPIKPKLPAVGGNEGVGEVIETGSEVTSLKAGDWVIPSDSGWGTWKTSAVADERELIKLPNNIPLLSAATLAVNPCTSYRMIKDFVELNPGDAIIQNGANSGVGQAVVQIASALGLQTINVVRDRPNLKSLEDHLTSLGADCVVTEEQLRKPEAKEILKSFSKPKLAFNCVGGKNSTELLRHIANNGVMVTYGGMSKQPVIIPTGSLIFKNISIVGFWMTQWNKDNADGLARTEMLQELADMIRQNKLKPPSSSTVAFKDIHSAISRSMENFTDKQILVMDE